MKILIELPTWLGDTIMATPAIENIIQHYGRVEITLIGSSASTESLKNHPNVVKTFVLDRSLDNLIKSVKKLEEFDVFFSFRSSFRTKFMKFFISSPIKFQYDNKKKYKGHQVEKYNNFINESLHIDSIANKLIIHPIVGKKNRKKKLLGINPGASYGSAKRWYPQKFADVAVSLSDEYDIIIFGGEAEKKIAFDIENYLIESGISNYQNLANKTSIEELISEINQLDLFITGDSGPMHLAAVFNIPTVSLFGPTNDDETSQWMNKQSFTIKKNLVCQPCMKRACPLNHHNCMKLIEVSDVLEGVMKLS